MNVTRRDFLRISASAAAMLAARPLTWAAAVASKPARLNFLFITADDMNCDAPGFTGCKVQDITPNLDKLASQSMWFQQAHVAIAICQPSRQAMMTGRHPHRNSAGGFDPIRKDVPTLQEQLHAAGYMNGILSKVEHLQPEARFCWDYVRNQPEIGMGRDPRLYHQYATEFLAKAKAAGQPFFLMANSNDPHRPYAGSAQERGLNAKKIYPPVENPYKPEQVTVPGFLPDIPDVRKEVAEYYTSVHRCDQTVGEILRALKESGMEDNTVVMFLSDNGMSFPFAKTNCYLNSTHTPWLVRWPGKVKPGSVDGKHFISGIDFMPTILEAAGVEAPKDMDGRSFLPLLSGKEQEGRDMVFTTINTTAMGGNYPMRAVQNKKMGYIFNAWANGKTAFVNDGQAGLTWKAMKAAAQTQPAIAERTKLFEFRVVEELYDFEKDPCALKNLAEDPGYHDELVKMRKALTDAMTSTKDPQLNVFKRMVKD